MQEIKSESSKVTLSLSLPPDFPVGSYCLELEVQPEGSRAREKLKVDKEMVVIFNPWCKGTCTCIYILYIHSYRPTITISTFHSSISLLHSSFFPPSLPSVSHSTHPSFPRGRCVLAQAVGERGVHSERVWDDLGRGLRQHVLMAMELCTGEGN